MDEFQQEIEEDTRLIAKKAFKAMWNDFSLDLKEGDVIEDCPNELLENLKTEGVI